MTANRATLWRSAGLFAVAALGAHLLWSLSMAELLASSYHHRMFDVSRWPRKLSHGEIAQLVAAFADDRMRDMPAGSSTVFIGSSFTFGYPWQESVVLSSRYSALQPGRRVLNVSIIGADFELLNRSLLCGLREAGRHIDVAVLEIPVVNAVSPVAEGQDRVRVGDCPVLKRPAGYLRFAVDRPIGVGWLPFIWDAYAYDKADEDIQLVPVRPGYFVRRDAYANIRAEFRELVAATVTAAKPLASRLVVFPSPVFLPGAAELGEDDGAVREQLDDTLAACRAVAGVVCLDPEPFYSRRDLYYNMTHLNQRGHQAMAEWLSGRIDH